MIRKLVFVLNNKIKHSNSFNKESIYDPNFEYPIKIIFLTLLLFISILSFGTLISNILVDPITSSNNIDIFGFIIDLSIVLIFSLIVLPFIFVRMEEVSSKKDYFIIARLLGKPITKKTILFPLLISLIFLITTVFISTFISNITQMFSVDTIINNSPNTVTDTPNDDTVPRDDNSNLILTSILYNFFNLFPPNSISIITFLTPAIGEEIIFRGILLSILLTKFSDNE